MQPMHDGAFSRYPDQKDFIDLAPEFGTRFTLFIDTEEEFDWHKPFSRTGYTVQSLKGLTEGQGYLNRAGVRPVHMVDYPVLESEAAMRSEEHTSELQSLMRISYAVFCLKKKKKPTTPESNN